MVATRLGTLASLTFVLGALLLSGCASPADTPPVADDHSIPPSAPAGDAPRQTSQSPTASPSSPASPEGQEDLQPQPVVFRGHLLGPDVGPTPLDGAVCPLGAGIILGQQTPPEGSSWRRFLFNGTFDNWTFAVDQEGLVVSFTPALDSPAWAGLVPEGATGAIVCSRTAYDVNFKLTLQPPPPAGFHQEELFHFEGLLTGPEQSGITSPGRATFTAPAGTVQLAMAIQPTVQQGCVGRGRIDVQDGNGTVVYQGRPWNGFGAGKLSVQSGWAKEIDHGAHAPGDYTLVFDVTGSCWVRISIIATMATLADGDA